MSSIDSNEEQMKNKCAEKVLKTYECYEKFTQKSLFYWCKKKKIWV